MTEPDVAFAAVNHVWLKQASKKMSTWFINKNSGLRCRFVEIVFYPNKVLHTLNWIKYSK